MKTLVLILIFLSITHTQDLDKKIFLDIKNTLNSKENVIRIKEYHAFISMFPYSSYQKQANYELAQIYYFEEEFHQALIYYLRTAILYSDFEKESISLKIKSIIENFEESEYRDVSQHILSALNYSSSRKLIDDLLNYIKVLDSVNNSNMFDAISYNSTLFLRLFPESINNDIIHMALAKAYHKHKHYHEALIYYGRIISFFEDSELQDEALYSSAEILNRDLSQYSESIKEYEKLYNTYPKSPYTTSSLYHIGYLYETELESNIDAIRFYKRLYEEYPSDSLSIIGLFRVAKLYEDKNAYDLAIETYNTILDVYPSHKKTPEAQMNIISAYNDHINDLVKAIESMEKFVDLFPKHPDAPYYLYEAAEIYREKLTDKDKAKRIYKQVIAQFNGTSYSEKSEDRLNDLNE